MMYTRKNFTSLTSDEKQSLVSALDRAKREGVIDGFARVHSEHFNHGIHRSSHFLPWHREFLLRFERILQSYDGSVTLPYWDSIVERSAAGPLWDNSFLGQFDQRWNLRRTLGRLSSLPTTQQLFDTQRQASYAQFWQRLEGIIHNPPHVWVGGVMASAASPGDPVFFLHHAWIDFLWVKWQTDHPAAVFEPSGPSVGLRDPMMEWPDRTPADVLDHALLGYRYEGESERLVARAERPSIDTLAVSDLRLSDEKARPFMLDTADALMSAQNITCVVEGDLTALAFLLTKRSPTGSGGASSRGDDPIPLVYSGGSGKFTCEFSIESSELPAILTIDARGLAGKRSFKVTKEGTAKPLLNVSGRMNQQSLYKVEL